MTSGRHLVVSPRYHVEIVPPSAVFLMNEFEHLVLQGPFAVEAVSQCRTPTSVGHLHERLAADFMGLEIAVGLAELVDKAYLVPADCDGDPSAVFWAQAGLEPTTGRLTVSVEHLGGSGAGTGSGAGMLRSGLRDLAVEVLDHGSGARLHVVSVEDYLHPGLADRNAAHLASGRPWALVKLGGVMPWIGPVFVPGQTGCWACLAIRLRANRQVETYLRHARRDDHDVWPPPVSLPATRRATADLAALTFTQWLRKSPHVPAGVLTTLDLRSLGTSHHRLTRLTHCPSCGTPAIRQAGRPAFRDEPLTGDRDGGLRTVTPSATLARLQQHISPITGLVHRLAEYDTGGDLLTVHRADHPLFTPSGGIDRLTKSLECTTAGKGRSPIQSKVSGLCEALERMAGRFEGHEVDLRSSWPDLTAPSVHPRNLLHFSDHQYDARPEWNRQHSGFTWIPEPFDEHRPIDWTAAWSLSRDRSVLLPTAYCYYNVPLEPGHAFCVADSNGCAAGNTLAEAVLQGFFELVERDAVALWWYNRLAMPAVDLDTIDDPLLHATRAAYEARNRDMWVLDLTSDLTIPVFAAVSRRRDHREEIVQGYGAHSDPMIALWRAVTEMSQMLAHLGSADLTRLEDSDLRDWYERATVAEHTYLLPRERRPWTGPGPGTGGTIADQIERCVDQCRAHDLELLVLDQTRPDVDLRVAKVVVPGLRHFWPRLAPGRLYEVPAALGLLPRPLAESELNPTPICT